MFCLSGEKINKQYRGQADGLHL